MITPYDLKVLTRRYAEDKARAARSYGELLAAIWQARDEGWRQVAIVAEVGLTRERVRQICDPAYRARRQEQTP